MAGGAGFSYSGGRALTTLSDLGEAISFARVSHKKAILRGDAKGTAAAADYLNGLLDQWDEARDYVAPDQSPVQDNSYHGSVVGMGTYTSDDLGNGYHVLPGGRRPTG
jgi:hypothetical protein